MRNPHLTICAILLLLICLQMVPIYALYKKYLVTQALPQLKFIPRSRLTAKSKFLKNSIIEISCSFKSIPLNWLTP